MKWIVALVVSTFATTCLAFPLSREAADYGCSANRLLRLEDVDDIAGALSLVQQQPSLLARANKELIPPRMIVQRGCTGSTVVMDIAVDLMGKLGIDIFPTSSKEMLRTGNPEKNPWYKLGGTLGDAVRAGVEEASQANQVLLMNGYKLKPHGSAAQVELQNALLELNTRTVIVHRKNTLDTLVCEVRDCFEDDLPRGYPVDQNGKRDDTCFDRRRDTGLRTKAFIYPEHLIENLEYAKGYPEEMLTATTALGFEGRAIVYFEDLTSHEYSAENLDRSTDAWIEFLSSLGVSADQQVVYGILKEAVGTYHAPEPHSETIYNLGSIQSMLVSYLEGSSLLRLQG